MGAPARNGDSSLSLFHSPGDRTGTVFSIVMSVLFWDIMCTNTGFLCDSSASICLHKFVSISAIFNFRIWGDSIRFLSPSRELPVKYVMER